MESYLTGGFRTKALNTLSDFLATDGYETALKTIKTMTPGEVTEEIMKSGLRGRGGAGFPTGLKWSFMPKQTTAPKYIVCNSDESEPGTFKDRQILENNPHGLIEGLLIASYAIDAKVCYIYIRGEYHRPAHIMQNALNEAYQAGFLGKDVRGTGFGLDVYLHRGAGAYVCGEETGLMESIEGKRGHPRKKPPFPAGFGLWGQPTTINNLETFYNIPFIIKNGSDWFRSIGTAKSAGNVIFSISGHVKNPGSYELPMGYNLKDFIYKVAGGIRNDHQLKAVIPGGSSTKVLPAAKIDVNMDHESLSKAGSSLGTGAVIVMDHTTCMVRVGIVISRFYRHESCGQCSICREGTALLNKLLMRIERGEGSPGDLEQLQEISESMEGTTICALSDAAAWPVQGLITHFRHEFETHISEKKCCLNGSFDY